MHHKSITKKRVALVYHFFPHYRQAVLRALAESSRYEFICVAADVPPPGSNVKVCSDVAPLEFITTRNFYWRTGSKTPDAGFDRMILWQSGLLRIAMRRDIDSMIFLGDPHHIATWLAAAIARLAGKRVLFWTIGWLRDERGIRDWIRRTFLRLAHGLLLYGNYARELAIQRRFRPENLYVIYNSLDYPSQKTIRETIDDEVMQRTRGELFPDPEVPILVCCSRLQEHRRLDWLLKAVDHLKKEQFACNILLIGDGPERESLERLACELDLQVNFFGACYDEEILARLIMSSDITVAPGMVGLTAMQSLAYGTPVITHNDFNRQSPEFEVLTPGQTGGFFEYGNPESLAKAIRKWLGSGLTREEIRRGCHRRVEQFYNPTNQRLIIERALDGECADPEPWDIEEYRRLT